LILELLEKKPKRRYKIGEVLNHPWIVGEDTEILEIRRKSIDDEDKVM